MPKTKSNKSKKKTSAQQNQVRKIIFVLGLVMFVNALSYGTIIPLLYPYATKFGIGPVGLGLLFASFSVAQLIGTPIIGRLSDRFGRKPLLLISLCGTAVSLALFASAQTAGMLFISRILDGITGGNNSVAQAIIADSFEGKERTKWFGMLGALFGVGFVAGPALGGLMSPYGLSAPFWFAAGLAFFGTVLGTIVLPETLHKRVKKSARLKNRFNPRQIITALTYPVVGSLLVISLLSQIGHMVFVVGFQSYTVDILEMTTRQIGTLFALIGLVSILVQAVGLRWMLRLVPSQIRLLRISFVMSIVTLVILSFQASIPLFIGWVLLYPISNGPQMALISALISQNTKDEDQGGILGINQSYMSLGQAIGPLMAALSLGFFAVPVTFWVAAVVFGGSWLFIYSHSKDMSVKVDL